MFKLTSSTPSFIYCNFRFLHDVNNKDIIISDAMSDLLHVCCRQALSYRMPNAIPLTSASREIACFKEGFSEASVLENKRIPFSVCFPVSSILELCDDFALLRAGELNNQREMGANNEFFSSCGWDPENNFNLTCLQSRLRGLVHAESEKGALREESPFLIDPFFLSEKSFFKSLSSSFLCFEISIFKREYLRCRSAIINHLQDDVSIDISMCGLFSISFDALKSLFISEKDVSLCLRLSQTFIMFFSSRLNFFCKPDLLSYFVWECFRFSGLIVDCFSVPDIDDEFNDDLAIMRCDLQLKTVWAWAFPQEEGHLRFHRAGRLSTVDLCKNFLLAYNLTGRSIDFDWPKRPSSQIIPECRNLFQEIFSNWLAFCQSKILPFVKAHDIVSNSPSPCPLSGFLSLKRLSALKCLESGASSDSQMIELLDCVLIDDEVNIFDSEMHFFLLSRSIFSKYNPQEAAKRCIACYVSECVENIESHNDSNARCALISLLKIIPYCASTYISFSRMGKEVKLFLLALKNKIKDENSFTQHSLNSYMMWIFSSVDLDSLQLKSISHLQSAISLF